MLCGMVKQKRNKKEDLNVRAFNIAQEATEEQLQKDPIKKPSDKNPHAVALGRLGGLKGGKSRASKLTPEQRKEIAQKAARARWGK